MSAPLSVIIPTLNAAAELPGTADALLSAATSGLIREMVISDGGSNDETLEAARELGAIVVTGAPGRGGQLARGVKAASAPWVLLLHADTHLSEGWEDIALAHINTAPDKAGWFKLQFRATGAMPALVATGANLRSRFLGLPYGDQGLLISAELLADKGGIPDLPLMEDVALARALKGHLVGLNATASTSAERFIEEGWLRRVSANLGTLMRYFCGVSPENLRVRYQRKR